MAEAAGARALRYVEADELQGWTGSLEGLLVENLGDQVVGTLDGFVLNESDRPFYLVVVTGGAGRNRRHLIPIGATWFDEGTGVLRTDVIDIETVPEFDPHRFHQMTPKESRAYERRVLENCCPETVRGGLDPWDYSRWEQFHLPGWISGGGSRRADASDPDARQTTDEARLWAGDHSPEAELIRARGADEVTDTGRTPFEPPDVGLKFDESRRHMGKQMQDRENRDRTGSAGGDVRGAGGTESGGDVDRVEQGERDTALRRDTDVHDSLASPDDESEIGRGRKVTPEGDRFKDQQQQQQQPPRSKTR